MFVSQSLKPEIYSGKLPVTPSSGHSLLILGIDTYWSADQWALICDGKKLWALLGITSSFPQYISGLALEDFWFKLEKHWPLDI